MKLPRGWLKREFKDAQREVAKWPRWADNLKVPHHIAERLKEEKAAKQA